MKNIIVLVVLLISNWTFAGLIDIPSDGVQRVILRGWEANVNVNFQPNSKNIKINGVEDALTPGLYIVERKGAALEIHMNEYPSKAEWKSLSSTKRPRHNLEISGAAVPLEIYLKEGFAQIQRWPKEVKVTILNGKIVTNEGQGFFDLSLYQGEIVVNQQNGKLRIDQYGGSTLIKSLAGDLELKVFAAPVQIEKAKGTMNINTQNSAVKINQSAGTAQFDNGKGSVMVQSFQGRVEGSTQEGSMNISLLSESEVHLRSQSGRVQIQLPPNSGAALNLQTSEGEILIPEGQKISRLGSEKLFRGRLRGESQKASVIVRSQEGSIAIK